jgi:hypothetical protein
MKRLGSLLTWLAFLLLLGSTCSVLWAAPPSESTPPEPPKPPEESLPGTAVSVAASHAVSVSNLKAILVVGPIDGNRGSWTTQEKVNMDLAAAELEAHGVDVHKFYAPNNDWDQIVAAADGAHFFLYRGHGVYWTSFPQPTVGGLALHGRLVSSDDIRRDLNLASNAIVMLFGCFTAGSSSIDGHAIGSAEAQRRVVQYSDPFFAAGASAYYANWYGDAFQHFLRDLFRGMTLGDAYEAAWDFGNTTVERLARPDDSQLVLWLDKDFWNESWQYNNAFTGLPDRTLMDLFQVTGLGVAPPRMPYTTYVPLALGGVP